MSAMDYGLGRRYAPHSGVTFPDYYCDERSTSFALSHAGRTDPCSFQYGGPVGGNRDRLGSERDDNPYDPGASRRRIAVACARCRKRKIRCSGDPGNGAGCSSCRQAGVEPSSCQFHRVGSDNVHKVIDNFHLAQSLTGMANSTAMAPLYSMPANEHAYARPTSSGTYPLIDTKPIYPSTWTVPYTGDTSPVETYGLEQQTSFLPNNVSVPHSNFYDASYRWAYTSGRPLQQASNVYYDEDPYTAMYGLPYTPNKHRITVPSEPLSPMNMSSLETALPSRPHRRYCAPDGVARQLPFPQPNPAQSSRNAVDNLQDQRLRSSQGGSASFMRPIQPWNPNTESLVNSTTATSITNSALAPSAIDGALEILATTAIEGDAGTTVTSTSPELNFSTSTLLEAMTASAPSNKYSNFRENRSQGRTSGQLTRQGSHTNLYSYNTFNSMNHNALGDEGSDDCKLVNGKQYVPLAHQSMQGSSMPESLQRDSFQKRNGPMQRESMRSLDTSF
ncbi:hypothetical protein HBI56_105180 [Parastagonospora nodorum]|uniref:Zn(2)-C6 fungal-type domain-containing protein n=2 Tax=Phaeosphaeria nodorum (strain SN15 / ATCC MYA-4574 / FGSC 10173) TaxID=321614 RepID=A0A7U2FCH1_PHANO|nr:hypothetical protein SNOG_11458 [Parastagonospora nodorum SN15]KAH3911350.1 hypothetical protein HBH56_133730 [Parastagonospora nodorum]EAT81166.1 hypothetical protein SNOG_11458 [Parastagonospora nodorum SN15]KAH3927123.1 hypothetical protein HBH54_159560 [Parastagonospora nodorum]KAH3949411.1 hypothetical protein HBH53_088800 [Parastagonospora nodorum]KAH3974890.1 hypothetical protein HBH52_132940 [Parastagonospora nodorum]